MFNVTYAAVARLAQELSRLEQPDQKVIRFCRSDDRMHLRLGEVQPGDQGFAHGGRIVFVVEPSLARQLSQRTLDIKRSSGGTKLSLIRSA